MRWAWLEWKLCHLVRPAIRNPRMGLDHPAVGGSTSASLRVYSQSALIALASGGREGPFLSG